MVVLRAEVLQHLAEVPQRRDHDPDADQRACEDAWERQEARDDGQHRPAEREERSARSDQERAQRPDQGQDDTQDSGESVEVLRHPPDLLADVVERSASGQRRKRGRDACVGGLVQRDGDVDQSRSSQVHQPRAQPEGVRDVRDDRHLSVDLLDRLAQGLQLSLEPLRRVHPDGEVRVDRMEDRLDSGLQPLRIDRRGDLRLETLELCLDLLECTLRQLDRRLDGDREAALRTLQGLLQVLAEARGVREYSDAEPPNLPGSHPIPPLNLAAKARCPTACQPLTSIVPRRASTSGRGAPPDA